MSPLSNILLAAVGLAVSASAATHQIKVGQNGTTFDPNVIEAAEGDVLEFHFWPKNHSVVMADWDEGCEPAERGGFFSGWFPTAEGVNANVFRVQINNTEPIAFYCSQAKHCQNGMVGVVNPTSQRSLASFREAAADSDDNVSPTVGVFGGRVAPRPTESGGGDGEETGTPTDGGSGSPTETKDSGAGSLAASLVGLAAAGVAALILV